MSLFNDLLGKVVGRVASSQDGGIQKLLGALVSKVALSGLAERFKQQGLEKIFASWVSQGKNLPINAEQIGKLLGDDQVREMADENGVSADEIKSLLAAHLPDVVDGLTPYGTLPEQK